MSKIREALTTPKTLTQIIKILEATFVCMLCLVLVEILFQIPVVEEFLSVGLLEKQTGVLVWVLLWLIMFLQCTILPIPAMPIYVFCNQTALVPGTTAVELLDLRFLFFVVFCSSACICGSLSAYWLGRKFGKKAVKWMAGSEEDYDKWSKSLNRKWGKGLYFCTVMFPLFPDDILSIVAGAIKMDAKYYTLVHCICKAIGIICTFIVFRLPVIGDFLTSGTSGGIPWALIAYSCLSVLSLSLILILKRRLKKLNAIEEK